MIRRQRGGRVKDRRITASYMMDYYGATVLPAADMPLTSVDGLPDATHFVELNGHLAKQVAHLALHKTDLDFVLEMLRQINLVEVQVVKEALWELAIIRFIKCFVGGETPHPPSLREVTFSHKGRKKSISAFAFFVRLTPAD
jgi:hypothetical protein